MCHGNIDPKFALREADSRLKGVSVFTETKKDDATRPVLWGYAGLRAALVRLMRKDAAHV